MKYKITFNASRDNNQQARDAFSDYISAVRDCLQLVDDFLGIYPEYESGHIEFEIKVTDNLLELSKDKHYRFINKIQYALYEHKELFVCELID
jgi:hypothetical protein